MRSWKRTTGLASILGLILLSGCATPVAPGAQPSGGESQKGVFKRITAAIMGEPKAIGIAASISAVPGEDELGELVLVGLSTTDTQGTGRPKLAEAVPSTQNGLWLVFPDGRMETTWKIRPGARWHDGVPFTADDLVFSGVVTQDRDLAVSTPVAYSAIESIEARDSRTLTVSWKRPFLRADELFSSRDTPLPRHLLEKSYAEDRSGFLSLRYWTEDFIGTGPFKVREWVRGSHIVLDAFDEYVLGRPKVDEIQVKFIPDQNTLIANVLAAAVEMTMGRGISFEQALQVRERWADGRIATGPGNPIVLFPQMGDPQPAVVGNPQFRRAMLHAIDRQAMIDTLLGGLSGIAYGGLRLSDADRQELDVAIVRYPYDPRAAARLVDGLGYVSGPDGVLRDAANQRLQLELFTDPSNDIQPKGALIVADYWQRVGVSVEPIVLPAQRLQDPAWKGDFRSFSLRRNPVNLDRLQSYFHSSQIPTAGNNYRGANYSAYRDAQMDAIVDRYFTTVPREERMDLARQIVRRLSDDLIVVGLFYDIEVSLIGNRIRHVLGRRVDSGESWNAEEWDVAS